MTEQTAILLDQQRHDGWSLVTLGSPALSRSQPGQYLAVRLASPGSFDPLVRQPIFVTSANAAAGTSSLLVSQSEIGFSFLDAQPRGAQLDVLGPLGTGWRVDPGARTLAIVGVAEHSAPLLALAHAAVGRNIAVSVMLGARRDEPAPPALLLPAAAEYNVARSNVPPAAALKLLDDNILRWADMLAIGLPHEYWTAVAQRVNQVRIRWGREFAQLVVMPPLLCCVGVCGVCAVETRKAFRLACVDGPVFDLRDLVR